MAPGNRFPLIKPGKFDVFRPMERCPRGRRGTTGNRIYGNVSRVRIPPSPPCFAQCFRDSKALERRANSEDEGAWMRPEVRARGLREEAGKPTSEGRHPSLSAMFFCFFCL